MELSSDLYDNFFYGGGHGKAVDFAESFIFTGRRLHDLPFTSDNFS